MFAASGCPKTPKTPHIRQVEHYTISGTAADVFARPAGSSAASGKEGSARFAQLAGPLVGHGAHGAPMSGVELPPAAARALRQAPQITKPSSFAGTDRLLIWTSMQALDELVARWRKNPDPESTLALCAHLGTSDRAELMREVASTAEAWHRDNHSVMLSVGRMYLDAGLLAEAQAALIQVGKLEPNHAEAYRYLGEVLLRRGDAIRAEKTLARAIRMGNDDADTRLWHERSVLYAPLQKRQSMSAVADEVARAAPLHSSIPAPALSPFERREGTSGSPRTARRSRPPLAPARPSGRRRSQAPGAPRRRGSTPPPAGPAHAVKAAPLDTLMMGRSPLPVPMLQEPEHPPSPFIPSESHAPRPTRAGAGARGAAVPRSTAKGAAASRQTPEKRPRPPHEQLLRRARDLRG